MVEEWRPIAGYEGRYEVSSFGNVRSITRQESFTRAGKLQSRRVEGRMMRQPPNADGYPQVGVRKNGKYFCLRVNRLVCIAFHGEPEAGQEAAHLDGVRTNSRADNLVWASRQENMDHRTQHGTTIVGEMHHNSKLTTAQVEAIRLRIAAGETALMIGRDFGVSGSAVQDIKSGRNWNPKRIAQKDHP